ncbi:MAG: capsule biosynthesis protein [Rhodobacteraceae bacterium]|nr:capsule biosynthesis protein [Paracoccaceae bacterium]
MTTTPKARKFRIRRTGFEDLPEEEATTPTEDGFGDAPYPGSAAADSAAATVEQELEAIRAEGLTNRQLRMARRLAQKQGLSPASDLDAVRILRAEGIDPFQRRNKMLELVIPNPAGEKADAAALPQTFDGSRALRLAEDAETARAREIRAIQKDIARRRRWKLGLLMARLSVFVFLPTALAGYYFYVMATPLYATKSEFVIQKAEAANSMPGLGGLFSGTSFATSQDSITVQGYLQSREAMQRLDEDMGFKAHFAQPDIDPLQRLDPDASNEEAYALYQRNVKISYDPTEGLVRMEVIAADPATSAAFSEHLIGYAEEQVDQLTQRLRNDQMSGALASFEEAEARMMAAQRRVLELQMQLGVLDPASESGAQMSQITSFEMQVQEKRLALQQLLENERPNAARVSGLEGDIRRLETLIADLRSKLTEDDGSNASLARITSELRIAEVDLETRQMIMQQSLQQLETARIEANRQVRYLSTGVSPVAPDEATYPRAFENTLVAFLIFSGFYLIMSITASVLREQVSA